VVLGLSDTRDRELSGLAAVDGSDAVERHHHVELLERGDDFSAKNLQEQFVGVCTKRTTVGLSEPRRLNKIRHGCFPMKGCCADENEAADCGCPSQGADWATPSRLIYLPRK
jgi:hypothetical protein